METDVVIAVMGLTGVGKSSFIKNVTGREDIKIGSSLISQTTDVSAYTFEHDGRRFTLVDTPGFDDSFQSDFDITEKILAWLETSYRSGTELNGILYLHSIAQPRMSGSAFDNLCMFRKLCGRDSLDSVVLATTFWDRVDPDEGQRRSKELEEDDVFWGCMKKAGSLVVTLRNDREDALKVLAQASRPTKTVLQAQREMVEEGKAFDQTVAGQFSASNRRLGNYTQRYEGLECLGASERRRSAAMHKVKDRLESVDEQLANIQRELEAEKKREMLKSSYQKLQKSHTCRCKLVGRPACAKCRAPIQKIFYHCCFCSLTTSRTLLQCKNCGSRCPRAEHPTMVRQEVYKFCVVM